MEDRSARSDYKPLQIPARPHSYNSFVQEDPSRIQRLALRPNLLEWQAFSEGRAFPRGSKWFRQIEAPKIGVPQDLDSDGLMFWSLLMHLWSGFMLPPGSDSPLAPDLCQNPVIGQLADCDSHTFTPYGRRPLVLLSPWWRAQVWSSKYSHKAWHVPLKYIKILQNTGIFETLPVPMWENICLILPASFWKGSLYQGRWVSTHRSWNQTLLKLEPEARRTVRAACVSVGTGLWIYIYIYRSRS